jgi:hypothetical protein
MTKKCFVDGCPEQVVSEISNPLEMHRDGLNRDLHILTTSQQERPTGGA